MVTVSDAWRAAYPGAVVGALAMGGVANPERHAGLDERKEALQDQLRTRFTGQDRAAIEALPTIRAYDTYYKRFKKTYHVQLQLESIVFKGKSLPNVAALVEASFMAELKNLLLTAGHDLDVVQPPAGFGVASGTERYTLLRGDDQVLKPGDMMMEDQVGVISSVIYGIDRRACITPQTKRVLFTVYAPPGIGEHPGRQHLQDIQANVLLIAPGAETELLEVFLAG
jgi:DNA/RNA-binding domain of Phe-tRNA-synthetase-like protein